MNDELLRVEGLFYSLGEDKTMLSNLSFSVQEGSFTLLCGPNGAGKSTLLRILKGLYPLKAGTIVLEGKDVTKREKDRLRKIGLVFQDADSQFVGQSVEKDIRFGLENLNLPLEEQNRRID
ncbi:MAG TPA: ATP-binding cassette domain-containing protein, partial [Sphaerochaeta sp.]|nr:ATP-binding cassette domain-containing protein [Sphaerochaeta sp.]